MVKDKTMSADTDVLLERIEVLKADMLKSHENLLRMHDELEAIHLELSMNNDRGSHNGR